MDDPEILDNVCGVSADELLGVLAPYGVTRVMLAYDCRHGYLPHPEVGVHESGRGRAGRYPAFAIARAKHLYRLRRSGCEPRTIRLLLFLLDGWGWNEIRDDCIRGAATVMGQSLNGLKRFSTKNGLDDYAVEQIVAHQYKALQSKFDESQHELTPTSQQTTRFVLSTFGTGEPLKGATGKRLAAPLLKAFWPELNRFQTWILCKAFDVLTALMDLRSARMLERIAQADTRMIEIGRTSLKFHHWLVRRTLRRLSRPNTKGICFNLITLGGQAKKIPSEDFARCGLSMYQALAAFIGLSIAIEAAFQEFRDTWRPIARAWIARLLRKPSENHGVK